MKRFVTTLMTLVFLLGGLAMTVIRGRIPAYRALHTWMDEYVQEWVRTLDSYIIWLLAIGIGLICINPTNIRRMPGELGLNGNVPIAFVFAVICTIPMFAGFALAGSPDWEWSMLRGIIFAPFFEELLFRGFAFRQLHRRADWSLWPAAIVTGCAFGFVHIISDLIQGDINWPVMIGTVAVTGAGGIFYAWLFVRWNDNLWVPILLHALMNLSWALFSAGENAIGGWEANVWRAMTIALAVVLSFDRFRKLPVLRSALPQP